jgi:GxxExxY protein
MNNRQRWAIIHATMADNSENKKALVAEEKARKKAEASAIREATRAAKAAEKAAAKAALPPKKRGRPAKVKPAVEVRENPLVPDMPTYGLLERLRICAEEVCASLGAGHLESIYHAAMAVELRLAGITYESEQVMPVTHKGMYVGTVRADIIVNKECVLEFKISGKVEDAKQQARQYMKLQGIPYGFVVMFPKADGGKIQFVDARLPDEE